MHTKATLIALALAGLSFSTHAAEKGKPNILVIVADDLGYGELTAQGFTNEIPTPNIDSIAKNGTRFTSGYVSGPYCSPTRAALLTGRYQQRFGHEFNPGNADVAGQKVGLDLSQSTLGNRLQGAGYKTAWIGKSHLGNEPEFHPLKRGFDYFYGFLGGAHSYLDNDGGAGGRNTILRGDKPAEKINYLTEEIGQEASGFIEKNKSEPWFTYLAFNAVHGPLQATEKYTSRFPGIKDEKRLKFAGMLSALDDAVGGVLAKLRETGQEENTLIFFIADNGGPTPSITSGNGPLRGYKAQTWEGGVRVAWFVQWKGQLPAAKVDERPVIQIDILPTALAAAGVETKPEWKLDGTNLLPYLKGEKQEAPHEALFWRFGQQIAVRKGDWKLVKAPGGAVEGGGLASGKANTNGAELYNLAQDVGEKNNLAAQQPEKVRELAAAWEKWNADNIDAKWTPNGRKRQQLTKRAAAAEAQLSKAEPKPADSPAPTQTTEPAKAAATASWKNGDSLSAQEAPQIANRALSVAAKINATSPNGVILALGAKANGISLYLHEGRLAFAVRTQGNLTTVIDEKPLAAGTHQVEARLASEGKIILLVDGITAAAGTAPALVTAQPKEGLSVGSDGRGSVGDYTAPNTFAGTIENATLQLN